MALSKKRQRELLASGDGVQVQRLYQEACAQWGTEKVHADPTRLWDLRCMRGINGRLPFGALACRNLGELLWLAREIIPILQEKYLGLKAAAELRGQQRLWEQEEHDAHHLSARPRPYGLVANVCASHSHCEGPPNGDVQDGLDHVVADERGGDPASVSARHP